VYAESIGMDENLSYYCLTFLNIGSLLGRISIPYAADRFGRFNLTTASALVTVASIFGLWLGCQNTAGVLAFSIIYGIFGSKHIYCRRLNFSPSNRIDSRF
jgi:MFS family permease